MKVDPRWVFYDENLIDLFLVVYFFIYDDTELCDGMSAVVPLIGSPVQPVGFGWTPGVCPGRLPVVEAGQTSDGVNIPVAASPLEFPDGHAAVHYLTPLSFTSFRRTQKI